jgi:ribosomal protein S18 acetylase RimI-like enzyme
MATIRQFHDATDRAQVIDLWRRVFGYEDAHNEPSLSITRKLAVADGLFFVATESTRVVGTVMAGYDGHRGWLYAVAVHPEMRGTGLGGSLVRAAENALAALGCVKINLQLVASNESTAAFYRSLGYAVEPRVSMGKLLQSNIPHSKPSH